jgi:hypothetical protein
MDPFLRMVRVGLQRQSVRLKLVTNTVRRNGKTAMGGKYATRQVVLTPGTESTATGMSLTALMDRIHSDGAILPGRNYFFLMFCTLLRN